VEGKGRRDERRIRREERVEEWSGVETSREVSDRV
jgi:hypothetical protein